MIVLYWMNALAEPNSTIGNLLSSFKILLYILNICTLQWRDKRRDRHLFKFLIFEFRNSQIIPLDSETPKSQHWSSDTITILKTLFLQKKANTKFFNYFHQKILVSFIFSSCETKVNLRSRDDPGRGRCTSTIMYSGGRIFAWCCNIFYNAFVEAKILPPAPLEDRTQTQFKTCVKGEMNNNLEHK